MRARPRGISLVETLMALAALAVVALAITSLQISATRFSDTSSAEFNLQHQLEFILLDIERNVMPGRSPIVDDPAQISGCATNCLRILRSDAGGTVTTVDYLYDATDRQISRRVTIGNGTPTTEILASGTVIRINEGTASVVPMFQISPSETGDLVRVNLSLETTHKGKTIRLKDVKRSILLRGIGNA